MNKIHIIIIVFILISPIYAYVGPGMGGGLIATILGIIGSIFLAIFGILYYPIKRFLKNRKKK
jgi:Na+/proline symporter